MPQSYQGKTSVFKTLPILAPNKHLKQFQTYSNNLKPLPPLQVYKLPTNQADYLISQQLNH
jgi:hypothetical protein